MTALDGDRGHVGVGGEVEPLHHVALWCDHKIVIWVEVEHRDVDLVEPRYVGVHRGADRLEVATRVLANEAAEDRVDDGRVGVGKGLVPDLLVGLDEADVAARSALLCRLAPAGAERYHLTHPAEHVGREALIRPAKQRQPIDVLIGVGLDLGDEATDILAGGHDRPERPGRASLEGVGAGSEQLNDLVEDVSLGSEAGLHPVGLPARQIPETVEHERHVPPSGHGRRVVVAIDGFEVPHPPRHVEPVQVDGNGGGLGPR